MTFSEFLTVFVPPSVAASAVAALSSWFFKRRLGRELAAYKVQLERQSKEQLLRATLTTERVHRVYSRAIRLLKIAEGRVRDLHGAIALGLDLHILTEAELLNVLKLAQFSPRQRDEFIVLFNRRENWREPLTTELPKALKLAAHRALNNANNHLAYEGLFLTKPVRQKATATLSQLRTVYTACRQALSDEALGALKGKPIEKTLEEAYAGLLSLEELMREDLLPTPAIVVRQ